MNIMEQLKAWFQRNRRIIFTMLFILILIQICTPPREASERYVPPKPTFEEPKGNELKSYEQLEYEQIEKFREQKSPLLPTYLFIVAATLVIFILQRKNIMQRLVPQRVMFNADFIKSANGHLIKITIDNKTRQTIELEHPLIKFSTIVKSRKFKITSDDFPLMLAPGTSHSIVFSPGKIVDAMPELNSMPFVNIEINASNGKRYSTLPRINRIK